MAKFYLQRTRITPENQFADREFERFLEIGKESKQHQLVDDPQIADVILVIGAEDMAMKEIRKNAIVRKFRDRSFIFYSGDFVIPFLPGLYPSIEKRWYNNSWVRSACYSRVVLDNSLLPCEKMKREYLYSFRGNISTSKVRQKILMLHHAEGVITDTRKASYSNENNSIYRNEILKSHFVLCPRGAGASSFRIFETMKMGRVPVILSDQWVEPTGPRWSNFSLRINERDYQTIPTVLQLNQKRAIEMGKEARTEWERHFAIGAYGDYLINQCLSIKKSLRGSILPGRIWRSRQLLHPFYFRRCVVSPFCQRCSEFFRNIICRP